MIIIGAGMAGLIAANILRRHQPVVLEAQPSLPNNHGALLRFRSDAVARAVGQPFKEVRVTKAVKWDGRVQNSATLQASNLYSLKVTGEVLERSIMNLEPSVRFIAPDTFCADLARGVDVRLGQPMQEIDWLQYERRPDPCISTIPMPTMMGMSKWTQSNTFHWKEIWSVRAKIALPPTRVYQTIYYPDHEVPYYRSSITGNTLIIEYLAPPPAQANLVMRDVKTVLNDFGFRMSQTAVEETPTVVAQKYGKLLPFNETERRAFILSLTDRFGIYSLGRFATWRQILLDDLVQDVRVIDRLVTERDSYARHLM